jgi:hypothetical protein
MLRMSGAIPLLPLYAVMSWTGKDLPFYISREQYEAKERMKEEGSKERKKVGRKKHGRDLKKKKMEEEGDEKGESGREGSRK